MLYNIFLIMLSLGLLLLATSIALIFILKIPDLIDELSGNKARRQIKRLKELNAGQLELDSAKTNDVYKALDDGSLLMKKMTYDDSQSTAQVHGELSKIHEEIKVSTSYDLDPSGTVGSRSSSLSADESSSASGYSDDDDEGLTGHIDINNEPIKDETEEATGVVDWETITESQSTGYMDTDEESTGYMESNQFYLDESDATGIMSDVEDFMKHKRTVVILEEQTSVLLSKEISE